MEYTANDVALWMLKEVEFLGTLYQQDAIRHIRSTFGEQFIFVNERGNPSISNEVKKIFRKLHRGKVAWDRDGFFWAWT